MRNHTLFLLLLALCGTVVDVQALAAEYVDPPGRVARLSYIDGPVSVASAASDASSEQWGEAVLNRPLTSADRIWVDAGARAELEVGSATLRLGENTAFSFVNLGDEALQMRLTRGIVTLRVRPLTTHTTIEIFTPNTTVTALQPGEYSIEAAETGAQTIVKVRSGEATVANAAQQAYGVAANETGVFSGEVELMAEITTIEPRTEFENWAYARDARELQSVAARYVAPEVIGYRDLDDYGTWYNEPEYGHVWRPTRVAVDWAPYRYGRWVWVSPWGWTWIDAAPWGFAPSHYGRWTYLRQRWCWVPGPMHIRPVYAPALVGWVGDPNNGFGNVGWFPLAPRETYLPRYRASWRHFHNVNVSNTRIVNNTAIHNAYYGRGGPIEYHNRHVPHALTVVPRDAFVRAGAHRTRNEARELPAWPGRGRAPTTTHGHDIVNVPPGATPRAPYSDRRATLSHSAPGANTTIVPQQPHGDRPAQNATQRRPGGPTTAERIAPAIQSRPKSTSQPHNEPPQRLPEAAPPSPVAIEQHVQRQWPQQHNPRIGVQQSNRTQHAPTADHGRHHDVVTAEPSRVQRPNVSARPAPDTYRRQPQPRSTDNIPPPSHAEAPAFSRAPERPQTAPLEQHPQRASADSPRGHQGQEDHASNGRGQDAQTPAQPGQRGGGFGARNSPGRSARH